MRFAVAAAVLATSVLAQNEPISTDYTTELVTITACPETVTDCPARSKTTSVATNYVPVSTSTDFVTHVYTVISCGPEVTNCPARSTVLSTTVVAVPSVVPSTTAPASLATPSLVWSNGTATAATAPVISASPATPILTITGAISAIPPPPLSTASAGGEGAAPPVCPGSSVVAVTKSYTTVLTSVEYSTIALPCPTVPAGGSNSGGNPGGVGAGAPSGTGVLIPPPAIPTGPAGNATSVPPPVNGAASFTGSAIFAAVAGVAAVLLA